MMTPEEREQYIRDCHEGQYIIGVILAIILALSVFIYGCAGTDLVYDLDNNGALSTPEQIAGGANIVADTLTESGIPYLELAGGIVGFGLSIFGVRRYKKNKAVTNGMSEMIEIAKSVMNDSQQDIYKRQITELVNVNNIAKETKKIKERVKNVIRK